MHVAFARNPFPSSLALDQLMHFLGERGRQMEERKKISKPGFFFFFAS